MNSTVTIDRPVETKPAVKTVADVLDHAALHIEEHGWYDGTPATNFGNARCAGTALNAEGRVAFSKFLGIEVDAGLNGIPAWNDAQPNAQAVIAALRAAAKANR